MLLKFRSILSSGMFFSEGCDKKNKTMMDFEVELLCWVRYKNKIVYLNLLQITGPGFTQLTSQAHVVEVSEHSFVRGMFFFFFFLKVATRKTRQ